MARVVFDVTLPGGFLIVRKGGNPKKREDTVWVQSDWDFAPVATRMGWQACTCGATDGTIDCTVCNRRVGDMLAEAYDFIREHEGKQFDTLDDYFE